MAPSFTPTNRPRARTPIAHLVQPPGNLYVSILLRTGQPVTRSAELSFPAALAVADTVEALLPRQTRAILKWPNDVLISGAKIAGILLEQVHEATILGIGLNVLVAPSNTAYKTTTIVANGGIVSVDGARDILLERLERPLSVWRIDGFTPIREQWLQRSYPVGAAIRPTSAGKPLTGLFGGPDLDGALLLDTPQGRERIVAGDVVATGEWEACYLPKTSHVRPSSCRDVSFRLSQPERMFGLPSAPEGRCLVLRTSCGGFDLRAGQWEHMPETSA
jgi:BirA family biotin operon repressor/biotin-[acetyl-CoA-carboxylase] ligase